MDLWNLMLFTVYFYFTKIIYNPCWSPCDKVGGGGKVVQLGPSPSLREMVVAEAEHLIHIFPTNCTTNCWGIYR